MNDYIWSLIQSDLTLCPKGFNTETYRVYEAMATGSIPVIEDVSSKGKCDPRPWRLLKKYNPPVKWVKNWDNIGMLIRKDQRRSLRSKIERRKEILKWYSFFKNEIKKEFLNVVEKKLIS